jgi:Cu(I)/Ag(I) efflux system membrane protein CusA/SilA
MIARIITFSIRNRFLVIVAGLVLALWGIYAVYHTPMDAIPDLSENQVIVFTEWPGHSAQEIETQVTYPLGLQLQGLAGVRVVRSASEFNFSMISIIFEDGIDVRAARQEISERLTRVSGALPPGVAPSLAPDAAATGQIYWYTVEGENLDLGRLRAVQDSYVGPQLASVPGVAEVAAVGGYATEYQVVVNPNRLRLRGVTLAAVTDAVSRSNSAVGGHVILKGNAEYIVRGVGWIGQAAGDSNAAFDSRRALRDLENILVAAPTGPPVRLADVASIGLGARPRRGVLEKDGNDVTGGVVLMRQGENPLEVTQRLKQKIEELQVGLPPGVRIVPFYDRTPLIHAAIHTVTASLTEAIVTAAICVFLVLLHLRTSFIIAVTLPLATLASFAMMWTLRKLGIADIQTSIMSLAGIAISIGVLVDASIVMAENVMHHLKDHFGDEKVRGDIHHLVLPACLTVGRPIFFSVVIMLLSFLPVFALGGIDGKMFHPLAFTKSFALVAVAVLAITLVPALCTIFIKGRLRRETESWIVRSVIEVYRPVLHYLLDRPAALVWIISVTFLIGLAPLGIRWLFLATLFISLSATALALRHWPARLTACLGLIVLALVADQNITPLRYERTTPLDEGMVMDMPISWPRASVVQSGDDLKARDMILCRFPEVDMVVGKAGRAETASDPAPMDMIETMVNFRPQEFWPQRKLHDTDAERQAAAVLDTLLKKDLIEPLADDAARTALLKDAVAAALPSYDAQMREYAFQRNQEFIRDLGRALARAELEKMAVLLQDNPHLQRSVTASDITILVQRLSPYLLQQLAMAPALEDVTRIAHETARAMAELGWVDPEADLFEDRSGVAVRFLRGLQTTLGGKPATFYARMHAAVGSRYRSMWLGHVEKLDGELLERAPVLYTRLILQEFLSRATVKDQTLVDAMEELRRLSVPSAGGGEVQASGQHHHGARGASAALKLDAQPALLALQTELARPFAGRLLLWRLERSELNSAGGEIDRAMQMPGWTNVWTMPIQNRVDMLYTGVNTSVGIRVLGRNLDDVVAASGRIAAAVKGVAGAVNVQADPPRSKGYLEIRVDRERALRQGVSAGDINDLVETALGGKIATTLVAGRERYPVTVRYPRASRESEESIGNLLVPASGSTGAVGVKMKPRLVPLSEVATIRVAEGPATIKSDNGMLRNYVYCNVRDRSLLEFVDEARRVVAQTVPLPAGVYLEWTGQFEHELKARNTLLLVLPLVLGLIFFILYWTYRDVADAVLMLLAVPGALAGGVFFQWLFGYNFSTTIWVGYIACFGMATSTGIIMLVYLREAVDRAGGLASISLERLRQAVMDGAVHRLRPKLLTEGTIVLGLAPMLWASGIGAEVIRPMAAPVLGGILIADEVIDLLLPVLFYRVRKRRWERLQGKNS